MVGNQVMLLLVDSGSTHSFISQAFADRIKATSTPLPPMDVRVANGERQVCDSMISGVQWWCQGHTFTTDMRQLALGACDGVLGMDCLEQNSPMNCHWLEKTISFAHQGETVTLHGVRPKGSTTIDYIEPDQFAKWHAGNDIWYMAVMDWHTPSADKDKPPPPAVQAVLDDFADVLGEPKKLPPHRQYDHAVTLVDGAPPANGRPYRYSPLQKDESERQVEEMLQSGVITHSVSPFAAPVLLVKKKDSTWRFCIDYRRLNDITIKNRFPLSIVDELLDELAGAAYFSKLDLRAGYHQIRMREEDEHKTAFKTHHGYFQFRVMPFGLTNAPVTFQCLMNAIFGKHVRKFVIIFLDDILVFSGTLEEHVEHLWQVFELLRQHELFVKASKCSFAQDSIEYLGHIISKEGVATDADKTQAMLQWPIPTTATELRGFLGLTGYYRKFVARYGIIAKPLTNLLTKKGFEWSEQAQTAFDLLKRAMASTPVLAVPDFDKPFVVETDACDTDIGTVLVQEGHPVAYFSKALGARNQKLSAYEKEFLAVMTVVEKWRAYLQRGPFTILTDHKSLSNLGDQQLETDLQRKAMSKLVGLQFTFQYRRGAENGAADALSRVGAALSVAALSLCQPAWVQEVANSYATDATAQEMMSRLAIHSPDEEGFEVHKGLIRRGDRLWIGSNTALCTKLISAFHDSAVGGHSGITATHQRVKKLFLWPRQKRDVDEFVKQCLVCQQAKHEHCRPAGWLAPLPVPTAPW
uniref:Reverse transcriptase domain-containing protein n=1 Tax=Aegilops tauschii subsp. strangulata TaxID=200361 RepID=A0A453IXZ7_AEGTS